MAREHVQIAQKLLLDLGYEPSPKRDPPLTTEFIQSRRFLRLTSEHTFTRENPSGVIDLHWEIQPFSVLPIETGDVLASTIDMQLEGQMVRTLEPNLMFVVLSAHASRHTWNRLIWICDTAQLLCDCNRYDWQKVFQISDRLGVGDMVVIALLLANRFFDSSLPDLAEERRTARLDAMIEEVIANLNKLECEGEGSQLLRWRFCTRLTRTISGRIRFLNGEIFQPTVPDTLRLRLPDSAFFLYYLLHPFWLVYDAGRRRLNQ